MSSDPRDFVVDLLAATPTRIEAVGRFVGIIEAPLAALDVQLDSRERLRRGPGGSILLAEFFKRVTLTSALAQTVRVLIADDVQDVSNVVTGGGGGGISITVSESPSSSITSPADVTLPTTETDTIPANAARKRITIGVLSTSVAGVRVKKVGDAGARGMEIQPGMYHPFITLAALDIENTDIVADNAVYWIFEEE